MKKLNLACGTRFHEEWTNIDFHNENSEVLKINLLEVLPFKDESFEVVYSSHFLEHLSSTQADFVLKETLRVLKDDGIIRLVVPDLENICREYLNNLIQVEQGGKDAEERYEWAVIELLDQLVRVERGGEMGRVFSKISSTKNTSLAEYVFMRTGDNLLNEPIKYKKKLNFDSFKNRLLYTYLKLIRLLVPRSIRNLVFINTSIGERHQWMYDRFSLKKKLEAIGFRNICIKSYNESDINDFNRYFLDINNDGSCYKGLSSLYIEARK